jgi:type IV pilus assembly protein PilA
MGGAASVLRAAGADTLTWTRDASGTWTCTSTVDVRFRHSACR